MGAAWPPVKVCAPGSVEKEIVVHHSRIRLESMTISLAAAFLLVFSAHSMVFNLKETSCDFLLDIVVLAGSSSIVIIAPRLSWSNTVDGETLRVQSGLYSDLASI